MSEMSETYSWEQEASPEEQQQYENALAAISEALYENDQTFEGIEKMLQSGDPIDAITRAGVTLITEVDKQINMPEAVLFAVVPDVFDMLVEIGTRAGFFEMDDEQMKLGLATFQETLLRAYGVSQEDYMAISQQFNEQQANELAGLYQEVTNGQGFKQGA